MIDLLLALAVVIGVSVSFAAGWSARGRHDAAPTITLFKTQPRTKK